MKYVIYLYLIQLLFSTNHLHAQCDPISASSCEKATVLCSLQELNSYCCQNIQVENPVDYPCGRNALCNAGGAAVSPKLVAVEIPAYLGMPLIKWTNPSFEWNYLIPYEDVCTC